MLGTVMMMKEMKVTMQSSLGNLPRESRRMLVGPLIYGLCATDWSPVDISVSAITRMSTPNARLIAHPNSTRKYWEPIPVSKVP
jgi:hypothetical protein